MEHHHLHRTYLPDVIYFVTTNIRYRKDFFRDENIAKVVEQSIWWKRRSQYIIYAYVVMLDHLHALFQPTKGNISRIMKSIKENASRDINKFIQTSHSGDGAVAAMRGEEVFRWQKGFYDHVIKDDRDLINHVEYIRYNPVRAGLCKIPEDYPFLFVDEKAIRQALG